MTDDANPASEAAERAAAGLAPGIGGKQHAPDGPRVLVTPGPQGPAASWQYVCDCGQQSIAGSEQETEQLAYQHRDEAHSGAGHVDVQRISQV